MSTALEDYVEHRKQGPFPNRVDLWAEIGRYHKQIHAGMIDVIASDLETELASRGYFISREASLQIATDREPDIFVRHDTPPSTGMRVEAYMRAAVAIRIEPGEVALVDDPLERSALHIRKLESGDLVTVLEIISPSNKYGAVRLYQDYRTRLLHQGVQFVELDFTRSKQRLLENRLTEAYPYHIAVYLPDDPPLVIGIELDTPLKDFALPLRNEVVPVHTQAAYTTVYRRYDLAAQLEHEQRYNADDLPFPSTLTPAQRDDALQRVSTWLEKFYQLRHLAQDERSHDNRQD